MRRGLLIAICGLDNSGKSVLQRSLENALTLQRNDVLCITHPPKEWFNNNRIFSTFIEDDSQYISCEEEVSFTSALRVKEQNSVIIPQILRGTYVISHRYIFCMYSNHYARQSVPMAEVYETSKDVVLPDITFYLKISANEFFRRSQKKDIPNFLKSKDNLYRTIKGYEELSEQFDFRVIDTEVNDAKTVFEDAMGSIAQYMPSLTLSTVADKMR